MTGASRATLIAAIVALAAGVAAAVVGVTEIVRDVARTVNSPVLALPADLHRHFDSGDYDVFQRSDGPTTLSPSDVTVSAATGAPVATRFPGSSTETLTRGGVGYTSVVRFTVPFAGDYIVRVRATRSGGDTVIVAKSFGAVARDVVPWIGLTAIGGLVALAAFVVLIVVIVQANRRRTPSVPVPATPAAASAPPGWYPDPDGPPRYRWWDGTRWTDHTS